MSDLAKVAERCGWRRKARLASTGKVMPCRLYRIWTGMRSRCRNPNNHAYSLYGGRGILFCSEWDSYPEFRQWAIAAGYNKFLSIDRVNNDGNYEPGNCRWATRSEQTRNRSITKVTPDLAEQIRRDERTQDEIAAAHNLSQGTISYIKRGILWAL